MRFKKHLLAGTIAALAAVVSVYFVNGDSPASPGSGADPVAAAGDAAPEADRGAATDSGRLAAKSLPASTAGDPSMPAPLAAAAESAVVSGQLIQEARQAFFRGQRTRGQALVLPPQSDTPVTASDASQVRSLLIGAGADFLRLGRHDDIVPTDAAVDDLRNVYYTFQQTYKGVPVEGQLLVVQTDPADRVQLITGQFEPNLNVDTRTTLDANQAIQTVLSSIADASSFTPQIYSQPELRILVDSPSGQPVLAFRAVVEYNDSGAQNHLEEIFVDARKASLLKSYSLVHTALSREIYSTRGLNCIGTPWVPESSTLPGTLKFGETGPTTSADGEERSAYTHTGSAYWFYRHMYSRDSYDAKGVRLRSSVHAQFMTPQYTCTGNNAQYRPAPYDQLIFGTGDNGPGLSESADVVGHELTHGVTYNTSALKYEKESGAINEALSDIFGAGINAWATSGGGSAGNPASGIAVGSSTWTICANCEAGLQRYMNNPTKDTRSKDYYPERYTGTDDNGGVHLNSGIMNLAFYLLSQGGSHPRAKTSVVVQGIGIEKALRIYYDANTTLFKVLTNTGTAFADARPLLAQAAETRYGKCSAEWQAVHASFQAVGVGAAAPSCTTGTTPAPTPSPTPAPAPSPTVNLALSATAYASSYYLTGYEPRRMNDGNATSQWRSRLIFSPYQVEYAALDFGKTVSMSEVKIDWSGSDYPRSFAVQVLDSNNLWKTVRTISKSTSGATTVAVSANTRMLRIVMQYGAYYRWFAINEITVK
jgi:Zn-dependent metalloprotease